MTTTKTFIMRAETVSIDITDLKQLEKKRGELHLKLDELNNELRVIDKDINAKKDEIRFLCKHPIVYVEESSMHRTTICDICGTIAETSSSNNKL